MEEEAADDDGFFDRWPWFIPLLIGLVSITAGLFTWRAGQLGSSAAYEDRQSVGQTIKLEQEHTEAGVGALSDAQQYVDYVAFYAEAAALDDLADEVSSKGRPDLAASYSDQADSLRSAASSRAAAAGVFGRQTLLAAAASGSTDPLPFDFTAQVRRLQTEASIGITSPGRLNPGYWAARADDTRHRVRELRLSALLLLFGVVALTAAEVGVHRGTRWVGLAFGSIVYVVVTVVTLTTVFF